MKGRVIAALLLVTTAACAPAASTAPPGSPAAQSGAATQSSAPTVATNPGGICGTVPSGTTGTVLFFSDLTAKCAAIGTVDDASNAATHGDKGYLVRVKSGPAVEFGGGPDRTQYFSPAPSTVRVEVDAQIMSGKGHVGIVCHRNEGGRAFREYRLFVGTDGSSGIEVVPPSQTIATGGASVTLKPGVNHIRADCIGPMLTLSLNGQQVATAQDDQVTGALNGIFLRSLDAAGFEVLFANLLITNP